MDIKGEGRTRPLSKIDVERFRTAVKSIFQTLDAEKIPLLAVEVGNEFNWAPFNGDFAIHPGAESEATREFAAMQNRDAIDAGFVKFVDLVRAVREIMKASQYNRQALLISGGLSDVPVAFATKMGMDMLPANQVLRTLNEHGLASLVDAYGMHTYPNPHTTPEERKAKLDKLFENCSAGPQGKPCWITEWGVPNTNTACPTDESQREPLIVETRRDFSELRRKGKLDAIFYFEWDDNGKHSHHLFRCGVLDKAGQIALAPEEPTAKVKH